MTDLASIYKMRRQKVYDYLKAHNIAAAVFEDSEEKRDVSIRYLTGHPSDALLILAAEGSSVLIPWDENLAAKKAYSDKMVPYNIYERTNTKAVQETLKSFGSYGTTSTVALPPSCPYPLYKEYEEKLSGWQLQCAHGSVHDEVAAFRAVKDEYEIACTRKACSITDAMTEHIVQELKKGTIATEIDVALYIERELRLQGCERTSFDTLAAGPERSFAIHAFPGYTGGAWGSTGLSILDYGVCYEGYASDCTITIARGPLSAAQEELLRLVQQAADECKKLYAPGKSVRAAHEKAQEIFATAGRNMPHGLGHGTGLEIHENPFVSLRSKPDKLFEAGNIVTLEPGLYDAELGGTRLENDVLITPTGNEVLTHSQIFRL